MSMRFEDRQRDKQKTGIRDSKMKNIQFKLFSLGKIDFILLKVDSEQLLPFFNNFSK